MNEDKADYEERRRVEFLKRSNFAHANAKLLALKSRLATPNFSNRIGIGTIAEIPVADWNECRLLINSILATER